MPRPLRINFEGAFYHVMNRGLRRFPIFVDAIDRAIFLNTMGEAIEKLGIVVHAYALMDNHYHLLVETPKANLSTAMRYTDGVYTQRYNRRHGCDGPLFRGRFKSQLIEAENYFLTLVGYIHLNSVRAGIEAHPLSADRTSHPLYIGKSKHPFWVTTQRALSYFSSPDEFDRHIEGLMQSEEQQTAYEHWESARWRAILGSERFVQKIMTAANVTAPDPERPGIKELLPLVFDPESILQTVAKSTGMSRELLVSKQKMASRAGSSVAAYLLSRRSGLSQVAVGKILGGWSRSAVASASLLNTPL